MTPTTGSLLIVRPKDIHTLGKLCTKLVVLSMGLIVNVGLFVNFCAPFVAEVSSPMDVKAG